METAPRDADIYLVTRDRDLGQDTAYPEMSGRWINRGRAKVFYLNTRSARQWWSLLKALRRDPFDLLYVNSLWEPVLSVLPILAKLTKLIDVTSLLVAPRGELAAGALDIKGSKKRVFLALWRPLLKHVGPLWHASAEAEAAEIRLIFPWAQIKVSLDQPALPRVRPAPPKPHDGPINFVFISRVSPKKNLRVAIEAMAAMTADVNFDIYGPIEDSRYWRACRSALDQLPANIVARYQGLVSPNDVVSTFARYDAFIFPTRGENFGHVIAESLTAFCPVICSDNTYWTSVIRSGGGDILADLEPDTLTTVLNLWASATPIEIAAAGLAAGTAIDAWRAERPEDLNILHMVIPEFADHR